MATTKEEMSKLMENVTPWYRDPGRRKLYALLLIALLSSATNGYDGSLMNGVQSITFYEKCKVGEIQVRLQALTIYQTSTTLTVVHRDYSMQFRVSVVSSV